MGKDFLKAAHISGYSLCELPGDSQLSTMLKTLKNYIRAFKDRRVNVVVGVVFLKDVDG